MAARTFNDASDVRMGLVSSVRLEDGVTHSRVRVWIRGGLAGDLIVNKADAMSLIDRLLPFGYREEEE